MILVDSSVWIDLFRGSQSAEAGLLRQLMLDKRVLVGDLVLCEVLMGARDEREALKTETALRQLRVVELTSAVVAVEAARHYRRLRVLGITVRSMADLLIGTWCILYDHELLHRDRDFDAMEKHLGLSVVHA